LGNKLNQLKDGDFFSAFASAAFLSKPIKSISMFYQAKSNDWDVNHAPMRFSNYLRICIALDFVPNFELIYWLQMLPD